MTDSRVVQEHFDQIALLPPDGFDSNAYYHEFLLGFLDRRVGDALDVGCGSGQFARLLAARADRVVAVDFSTNMLDVARGKSDAFANIDYRQADVLDWDWPVEEFDCIASIATLHHLPMEDMLRKLKVALRPGGVLLILDLWRAATPIERLALDPMALAVTVALRMKYTGRIIRARPEARRLWDEHGKTDRYLSMEELRRVVRPILPDATISRHLLWRYSLIWRKP